MSDKKETGHVFERQVFIGAKAEKVWEALVTPAIAEKYFLAPLMKIELKAGGEIKYGRDGKAFIEGKVLEVENGKKLVHSFSFDSGTHKMVEQDAPTKVTYEIEAMGEMCHLTLRHEGFGNKNQTYANVTGGWDVILSSLKTLLETGKTLPWPKP